MTMLFKNIAFGLLLMGLLSGGGVVLAQGVRVDLSVSNQSPVLRKPFDIIVQITKQNENSSFVSQGVTIPGIENFAQVGTSNSTSITNINGQTAVASELRKTVLPTKTGTFTIGPIEIPVRHNGAQTTVKSNTVQVTVRASEGTGNASTPPQNTLGDNSGFFEDEPASSLSTSSVAPIPNGNMTFWLQVGGLTLGLWFLWFFVNKKLEQRKRRNVAFEYAHTSEHPPQTSSSESFSDQTGETLPQKKELPFVFPAPDDPNFLSHIHDIFVIFCDKKLGLPSAKITQSEIVPQAQKYFSEEALKQFQDLLATYQKARFAKFPIDQKVFVERLELFLRKHY